MLRVAPRTIAKACDKGVLKSHCLPCSKHRRILRTDLIAFLKQNGQPLPPELRTASALMVSDDVRLSAYLRAEFADSLHVAETAFLAGRMAEQIHPTVLILDARIGAAAVRAILADTAREGMTRIVIVGEDDNAPPSELAEIFRRPFDPSLLANKLRELLRS